MCAEFSVIDTKVNFSCCHVVHNYRCEYYEGFSSIKENESTCLGLFIRVHGSIFLYIIIYIIINNRFEYYKQLIFI